MELSNLLTNPSLHYSNHPLILGNDNCNVRHIVAIILEVFARSVIEHTGELGQKLIQFVKYANVCLPFFASILQFLLIFTLLPQLDSSVVAAFSLEQQQALEQISKL